MRLPLEPHLTNDPVPGSMNTLSESDPQGPNDVWARISIVRPPAAAAAYLRLGATPENDSLETGYRAFSTQPGSSPFNDELNIPNAFDGIYIFDEGDFAHTAAANQFGLTGGRDFRYVAGSRRLIIHNATTTTTDAAQDDPYPIAAYAPANTDFEDFALPEWLEGTGPTTVGEATFAPITYQHRHDVGGSRRVRVYDLLTQDVRGDRAAYVRGDFYRFVLGDYALDHDGDFEETQIGDRRTCVKGNRTTTIGSSQRDATSTSTLYGDSTSRVTGDTSTTVYGYASSLTGKRNDWGESRNIVYGARVSVGLGARFAVFGGVRISVVVAAFCEVVEFRFDMFGVKIELVAGNKIEDVGVAVTKAQVEYKAAKFHDETYSVGVVKEYETVLDIKTVKTGRTEQKFQNGIEVKA